MTAECHYIYNGVPLPPSKLPHPMGYLEPYRLHGSLGPAHPSPQPKRHLDQCGHFTGLTSVTGRQTDHAIQSVTKGRMYVRRT